MRSKHVLLGSTAALIGLAVASPAAVAGGFYASIFGGLNHLSEIHGLAGHGTALAHGVGKDTANTGSCSSVTNCLQGPIAGIVNTAFSSSFHSKLGFVVGATVGHDLDMLLPNLRGEFEVSYRQNDVKGNVHAHGAGPGHGTVDTANSSTALATPITGRNVTGNVATDLSSRPVGDIHTWAVMANAFYDVNTGSRFKPYFGGGVGWARNTFILTNGIGNPHAVGENDGFAWQLGAGVNLQLSDRGSVGLGYRYMDAGSVDGSVTVPSGTYRFSNDVRQQSLILNFSFGLP